MKVNSLQYLMIYITPTVIFYSLYSGGWFSYSAIIFNFFCIPLVELFTRGSTKNMNEVEEAIAKKDRVYDFLLYALVPMQYAIMYLFLSKISNNEMTLYEKIGMTTAYGISCGVLGINTAHELGHRNTKIEKVMSKMLLLTSLYMHFIIEHNRGHHKNVSTNEDPASSRFGESVYAFYIRSIRDSWLSAWKLEAKKLSKNQHPFWSQHNEMIRFQLFQLTLISSIAMAFGWQTLLFFVAGAGMGCLLLETVNYIEHYGLRRKKVNDYYERTLPVHSWNSNHPIGRLLLFELSRHSDHHYMASRKYQILRHFDESPQMPTGYPGMMVLSLIPPLWFYVMNKKIDAYRKTTAGFALG